MIEADKNKFYHVFTAGSFPTYDWEHNEWTTFEVKKDWVKSVSDAYDAKVHKAPLWIGHPWYSGAPAEGWIAKSKFEGKMLFNSFEYIDENFVKAVQDKKYLYVSCEFGRVMGIDNDYQVALGATNLPKVSGQKPLEFEGQNFTMAKGHSVFCPIDERFTAEIAKDFTASSKKFFFQNQNTKTMDPILTKLATVFAIDVIVHATDEAISQQAIEKFSKLSSRNSVLEDEVKSLRAERVTSVLNFGLESGRILPADKETYETLLNSSFEATKKVIEKMPVNPAFEQKNKVSPADKEVVDPSGNRDDKFSNEDGTKMNYDQFLAKVEKDPSFAKKFTNKEIFSIPGADKLYQSK